MWSLFLTEYNVLVSFGSHLGIKSAKTAGICNLICQLDVHICILITPKDMPKWKFNLIIS